MKILYVIDRPNLFGSELHLLDILKYQYSINSVEVVAFRSGPLLDRIQSLGIPVYILSWNTWLFSFKAYRKLATMVKVVVPDLIHSHQPKANFYMALFSKVWGIKHIATMHTMPITPSSLYKFPLNILVYAFYKFVILFVELLSDKSIYVSNTSMRDASVIKSKVVMIYNWLCPCFNNVSFSNHIGEKYLCIGSISPTKGIEEVIHYFKNIREICPQATLSIAGSGPQNYLHVIQNKIKELGLSSSVFLLGYQDNVGKLYEGSNYFISLTKGESFGLVFVEAMYYGLPVICSNIDILREIVCSQNLFVDNGVFVKDDFQSFLVEVSKGNISLKNHNWITKNFNYDLQQRKLNSLYNKVVCDFKE